MSMLFARVRTDRLAVAAHARAMATQPRSRKGYEAFGSFHSPSAEALFSGHVPPDLPDPSTFLPPVTADDMLKPNNPTHNRALFTIDFAQWTYLNHGAFGGPTRYATRVASAWRALADAQPVRFHDRLLFPFVVQSIQALARVLCVGDARELVLLPNATSGLHAVLDSVLREPVGNGDAEQVVLCFSTRYGAVRKMLQTLETSNTQLRVHEEPLSLEESYDDAVVLHKLERALDEIPPEQWHLVVVDHITSNTGVLLPVEQIVQRCHARGVPVLVDGAHGLFNLPLDLDALGADYYVGNCHKWFASPKGAAFLHVKAARARPKPVAIRPRVVSHGVFDGFQSAFMWTGLQDYAPWLALPRCIDFWHRQDPARCRAQIHALAQTATELLYAGWGMHDALERAKQFPLHKRHAMRLIQLPSRTVFGVECNVPGVPNDSRDAKHIQDTLHHAHRIEVPIKCVDGKLFVRISAHVYNAPSDYERLAQVVWAASEYSRRS